jgi:PAS domain S-box-containing protein
MTERLTGSFFRSAIEGSPDSVRVLDLEGRLLFMNRGGMAAFEIKDFTPFAGRACASLWPEPAATEITLGIEAAVRHKTHRFEGMCPTTSGVEKWWDVFVAPVYEDGGDLSAIMVTARDITAAHVRRAEAEEHVIALARTAAALRSAFGIAHVGGWEVDFEAQRVLFSPELCELLGSKPLPSMTVDESFSFWFEDDRAPFAELLDRIRVTGEHLEFDGRTLAADGSFRLWRLYGEPVMANGRCVAVRGAAQDVTDWQSMRERERAALNAADNMSSFLATMGHELRTPLNGILGMTQALARSDLTGPQRERIDVIRASGEALLSLLNDLLDFSKIEVGKIDLEEGVIDTQELIDGVLAIFGALAQDKGLALRASVDADAEGRWRGDPTRVRQVLHKLISNAVKFTEQGSIDLVVSYANGRICFSVRDTGIGIAPDKLDKIFSRFVQEDSSATRRYGGSGLGLTICRELVTLMGGEIVVRSVQGSGATFVLQLPLERLGDHLPSQPVEVSAPADDATPLGLRVLAAEDNPTNQMVLRTLLRAAGIEPVIVSNGQEALEEWNHSDWDIVLMDIQMPVMDGLAAVRSIRELERSSGRLKTPMIAVTANALSSQLSEYLTAGMDAVVPKPIELALLLNTMHELIGGLDECDEATAA